MATITFDGTSNQTANLSVDNVLFTANPTLVTSLTQSGFNVVFTVGSFSLTLQNADLSTIDTSKFQIPGGIAQFGDGLASGTLDAGTNTLFSAGSASVLFAGLGGADSITVNGGSTSSGNVLVLGGSNFNDSADAADTIQIVGKGNYLVYGNGGDDTISMTGITSGSTFSVYGGVGADSVLVGATTASTTGLVFGGQGADSITAFGAAGSSQTIYGGVGFIDTVDVGDLISVGGAGAFQVYGNFGADSILATGLANGATYSVFGGQGADSVVLGATGVSSTGAIFGGQDSDLISVLGAAGGSATIYGGTGFIDSTDAADTIFISGAGAFQAYGNSGDDSINGAGLTAGATYSVFGGTGADTINFANTVSTTGSLYGGQGSDTIIAGGAAGGSISVFGGVGVNDSADLADVISIGGAGSFTVYANAGADSINGTGIANGANFSVFGGTGNDSINFDLGTAVATLNGAIYGGEGLDTITVEGGLSSGTISVFGGVGFSDSIDGADNITAIGDGATAAGKFFIYGNGGADSITLTGSTVATDGVNLATVFGGAGNDTINVAATAQAALSVGGIQLSGNDGSDTFVFGVNAAGSGANTATAGASYVITDFTAGAGGDVLNVSAVVPGTGFGVIAAQTGSFSDALTTATATATTTRAFQFGTDTYVVVNNGTAGFDVAADTVIKLTGVTASSLIAGTNVVV